MSFNLRKPFVRRTTDHPIELQESIAGPSSGAARPEQVVNEDGKTAPATSRDIDNEYEPAGASTAVDQLEKFRKAHKWDYNLDYETIQAANRAADTDDLEKKANFEHALLEEDSPYFEVRTSVPNYDEDAPANTIRAWVLGLIATTLVCGANLLFSLRAVSITIYVYIVQLLAYPIGVGLARVLPNREFNTFGLTWNLNPGPFNKKEHAVIVMMSSVSIQGGVAYATDVLLAQQVFYKQNFGWGFQLLLLITTQCLGFGMAGIVRRFLIWPAAMIWPQTLAQCAMLIGLHDHSPANPAETNGWRIGRYRYFLIVLGISFVWYWFPGWIATGISYFPWITWIAPNNMTVNQIFGNVAGFGILPFTMDWTIITGFIGSPLPYPMFAIVNTLIGVFIFFIVTALGVYYTNTYWTQYLPIASVHSFDNTGATYNVSRILTPEKTLDIAAYKEYSPIFLGSFFTITYGLSFATLSAVIVHTAIFHGSEIIERFKLARNQDADIHLKMMRKYPDTPNWWYYSLFIVLFALSLVTILVWDTHMTWWSLIIAILLALIFLVPIGMVQAITNNQPGLNVLTEFMVGYMLPGRPIAMMLFKTYGYIAMAQALYFLQDMKFGHYMKVPPRVTFWAQTVACFWSCIVQVAVLNWALGSIEGVCDPDQPNGYTCPNANVFYTASVLWGLIGPARVFGAGSIYENLQWFWLVGAAMPLITWFVARRFPGSPLRYLHWPIIFGGSGLIPPATVFIYLCWGFTGMFFNGFLRRRYAGWWGKYNYITSAGLDTGLYLSTLVIFFALALPEKVNEPQWFMNAPANGDTTVNNAWNTLDALGAAIPRVVADGETFGPSTW